MGSPKEWIQYHTTPVFLGVIKRRESASAMEIVDLAGSNMVPMSSPRRAGGIQPMPGLVKRYIKR